MGQYCFARYRLLASVVCRRRLSASSVVCNAAGRRARGNAAWKRCRRSGRPGAWTVGAPATGRVGGPAADIARRASTVTSR